MYWHYQPQQHCHQQIHITLRKLDRVIVVYRRSMGSNHAVVAAAGVPSSQNEVFLPVFETVWRTASGCTLPLTVTFCPFRSTSKDSTPEGNAKKNIHNVKSSWNDISFYWKDTCHASWVINRVRCMKSLNMAAQVAIELLMVVNTLQTRLMKQ